MIEQWYMSPEHQMSCSWCGCIQAAIGQTCSVCTSYNVYVTKYSDGHEEVTNDSCCSLICGFFFFLMYVSLFIMALPFWSVYVILMKYVKNPADEELENIVDEYRSSNGLYYQFKQQISYENPEEYPEEEFLEKEFPQQEYPEREYTTYNTNPYSSVISKLNLKDIYLFL